MDCLIPAIASMSLGRASAGHKFQVKIEAATAAGFKGIEIFYEDLESLATDLTSQPSNQLSNNNLLEAAIEIKRITVKHNIAVIALQPFMFYEGILDRSEKQKAVERFELWLQLADELGTNIIQIPSNFARQGITGDLRQIVADLQLLADRAAAHRESLQIAYEGLCWGRFVNTWRQAWHIVKVVDRTNLGLCLDIFHLAGKEWADPATSDGKIGDMADTSFRSSLKELVEEVDVAKVLYVQLADAKKPLQPMNPKNAQWVDGQDARLTWSRNLRVFPGEEGGYMPVLEALRAIVEPRPEGLGYRGWLSLELFSTTMFETGPDVPHKHAQRGSASFAYLQKVL